MPAREFRLRATYGMDQELDHALSKARIRLDEPNIAPMLASREPIQAADLAKAARSTSMRSSCTPVTAPALSLRFSVATRLSACWWSAAARPARFAQNSLELMKTFAAQSALAIQNARLFHEIEEKGRQLEIASQHKSQFLANMSHELRTPLNAILGYTELIADGAYGDPSEKMLEALKRLEINGKHLLGLINDVLDLSKIEAGQLELELSDYSLEDIAQIVRITLEPLAADKRLAFKVEMPARLPPGHGDGRRLTQVLINLVGNAIKFTDAGEVAIKAEANNGAFYVSVRDTGPGISAADQTKLFQEFQQADNAITKEKGGTGLGLAISKRIIEMHGGRIWVELQPGQGSTFAFTLPVIVERQVNVSVGAANTVMNGPQGNTSDFAILGKDVTATSTGLFFNFGDPNPGLLEFLGFYGFVCFQNQDACLSSNAYANSTLLLDVFGDPTDALGPISELGTVEFAIAETPLPSAIPLFAGGLGALGLFGWRRKRKISARSAA